MNKKNVWFAAAIAIATFCASRGAMSGPFENIDAIKVKGALLEGGDAPATPETSVFDTLTTISGRVTSITATDVGNYVCKDGAIKLAVGTGLVRTLTRDPADDSSSDDLTLRATPVKAVIGGKTVLIPSPEPERFKAVMSILHAAKLTNKDVTLEVAAVPNCANTFYAADASFN